MFIGHFGLALGAKKRAPELSLGTLFLGCQFADLLWPTFVLAGIEVVKIQPGITTVTPLDFVHYPYSHSLVALFIWAVAFAIGYMLIRRSISAAGLVIGALVLSHWFLDYVVHRPDLPLTINGTARYGLGLWNSLPATLIVELFLFLAGVGLYARFTEARDRWGHFGFWALVVFLLVVYIANIFGPPPPSDLAVAWAAEAMWLLVAWGYWIDRHRRIRGAATES
jgi:membrane-bound metal-dependent hydrolase YbcI (DUF457 family)